MEEKSKTCSLCKGTGTVRAAIWKEIKDGISRETSWKPYPCPLCSKNKEK